MGSKGERTREHILGIAESMILQRGYSGTSIDDIIAAAGITKGGFFYHFDGKNDLARHLIKRYLREDNEFFSGLLERARGLTEDPLQQFLVFLKLMAEAMQDLPGAHPGCLVASFTYESQQFDDEVRRLNEQGILAWRKFFGVLLQDIADRYPARIDDPAEKLADMLTSVIEGAIVMSRCLDDPDVLPNQLLQYRNYVQRVFAPLPTSGGVHGIAAR